MIRERTGCLIQQPTNGSEGYKKQAYLNGVVEVRELRVRYRKTTLLCAYLYTKKEGTSRQILS